MNDKIIGILGGMGPEASAAFYIDIIKSTKVTKDQDHFRIIIDSNSKIPDRTRSILYGEQSPLPMIIKTAQGLESMGATQICIPCITSHYFYDEVAKSVNVEVVNFIQVLEKHIEEIVGKGLKIGVICTTGTMRMKLFDKYIKSSEIMYPNDNDQKNLVMEAIYGDEGIKSGYTKGKPIDLLNQVIENLENNGAKIIIAGCTEIGLVKDKLRSNIAILDPMEVVAKWIVKEE
jgi:aspartate racemase